MTGIGSTAIELLEDLVSIDSVNPSLVPGAAGEREIVDFLAKRLTASGFTCHVISSAGRPSLLAMGPEVAGPSILLNGHLDTVGVSGMDKPFTPHIDGDRLYARGAADMKGGVAALIVAAEELVRTAQPVQPILALVADEEDASVGSEAVIRQLSEFDVNPTLCIIGEPTDTQLTRTLRGFAVVSVSFAGKASHSSQPDSGINAVTSLGRFLAAIDDRRESIRSTGGDIMVTVARGGESPFVIPDFAECVVERRTMPGESASDALREVRDMLRPEWLATAELRAHRDAWMQDSHGVAERVAAALGTALGTGTTFEAPYWMEAPLWQTIAPTIVCGPSGGGLHAVDEWVSLAQVSNFTAALVEVLPTLAGE